MPTLFLAVNYCTNLCNGINNQTAIHFSLSRTVPTAQLMVDGLKHTTAVAALVPLTVVVDIGKDSAMLDFVSERLETLSYDGGDVPQAFGNIVTSKIQLVNVYGASEMGVPPSIRPIGTFPRDDWKYVNIHPDAGVEFEHCSEDLYELCIVKNPEAETYQPVC